MIFVVKQVVLFHSEERDWRPHIPEAIDVPDWFGYDDLIPIDNLHLGGAVLVPAQVYQVHICVDREGFRRVFIGQIFSAHHFHEHIAHPHLI